jgi:hypothetical protein
MKCEEPASESERYKGVLGRLELGVGVRADFAVQVDLFVLRGNPFHERLSLREFNDTREHSTGLGKGEEVKSIAARAGEGAVLSLGDIAPQ